MIFLFITIIMFIYLWLFLAITIGGFSLPGDYDRFYNYLSNLAVKERIFIVYHNSLKDLNKNRKDKKRALGTYNYVEDELTSIEKFKYRLPRIELSKESAFNNKKSVFNLMTFAHELGHHFAITRKKDTSEKKADEYAVKILKKVFPTWKLIIYSPILLLYLTKN